MKQIMMQHEITEALEKRSGVEGLKLIRMKGYNPSWELGGILKTLLSEGDEAKLEHVVTSMQREIDMA